jgi:hypothetical protein
MKLEFVFSILTTGIKALATIGDETTAVEMVGLSTSTFSQDVMHTPPAPGVSIIQGHSHRMLAAPVLKSSMRPSPSRLPHNPGDRLQQDLLCKILSS